MNDAELERAVNEARSWAEDEAEAEAAEAFVRGALGPAQPSANEVPERDVSAPA